MTSDWSRQRILSPIEKAIYPWIASLSGHWEPFPADMTDAEERALDRLILGGFIETKMLVTMTVIGEDKKFRAVWRLSGACKGALDKQIAQYLLARGCDRSKDARVSVSYKNLSIRLTADGERIKEDFKGNHEFEKPEGVTSGMPLPLFDEIAGGPDGLDGCVGKTVCDRRPESEIPADEGSTNPSLESQEKSSLAAAHEPSFPEESATPKIGLRTPPDAAVAAYRLHFATGAKQTEIAKVLQDQLGRPVTQGQVSRWLAEVHRFLRAGNVLPDPPKTPRAAKSMDPSRLDLGARMDGRTPHQRQNRTPE